MSTKDLAAKYGGGKGNTDRLVNRAIRAEIPGGGEALDLLNTLRGRYDADSSIGRVAVAGVRQVVYRMVAAIRERYGLPPDPHDTAANDAQPASDAE